MQNTKRRMRIVLYVALLLLTSSLLGCTTLAKDNKKPIKDKTKPPEYLTQSNNKNHEIGITESIIDYGNSIAIGAHYPKIGKKNIDAEIKKRIEEYITKFKEETKKLQKPSSSQRPNAELNIDYESYLPFENVGSVVFTVSWNEKYLAHPDTQVFTYTFLIKEDREITFSDIFKVENLPQLLQLTKEGIRNNPNYKSYFDEQWFDEGIGKDQTGINNFILRKDKITFIFQRYSILPGACGNPTVEIPYSKLKQYLKIQLAKPVKPEATHPSNKYPTAPKRHVDPNKPMVALTYDDGPHKVFTKEILNTLKRNNAVATFFVLGNRVGSYPDIMSQMVANGNEIGNHSFNHRQLTTLSISQLKSQINNTQKAVHNVTNIYPKFIRPTYGAFNQLVKDNAHLPIILWSIDTLDWKTRNTQSIVHEVKGKVKDGDIILMHDIYNTTADATEIIVKQLKQEGFQLVTVSELMKARGQTLQAGKVISHVNKK